MRRCSAAQPAQTQIAPKLRCSALLGRPPCRRCPVLKKHHPQSLVFAPLLSSSLEHCKMISRLQAWMPATAGTCRMSVMMRPAGEFATTSSITAASGAEIDVAGPPVQSNSPCLESAVGLLGP